MDLDKAADSLRAAGWGLSPPGEYLIDMEPAFLRIWEKVHPYTMTSVERAYGLYQAVVYLAGNRIPGDLAECGVWKGGSCLLMALTLAAMGDCTRKIYLYDTFAGMTPPGKEDIIAWNDLPVRDKIASEKKKNRDSFAGWAVKREDVEENLRGSAYPMENFVFVPGDVEKTLPQRQPSSLALLRLDTDWYASTKTELEILYPRLVQRGVLIIDDYGHFKGARRAVDEYFSAETAAGRSRPLFCRLDYTGRLGLKL